MARRSPTGIAPEAPRMPDELELAAVDAARVESGEEWRRVRIVDADLPDLAAPGLRFEEARLERVDLGGGRLAHLALSRLTGVSWTEGLVRDTVLSDCRIDLSSFAATRFDQVVFERCLLTQADFQEANLRAVRFVDCDLTEADLMG